MHVCFEGRKPKFRSNYRVGAFVPSRIVNFFLHKEIFPATHAGALRTTERRASAKLFVRRTPGLGAQRRVVHRHFFCARRISSAAHALALRTTKRRASPKIFVHKESFLPRCTPKPCAQRRVAHRQTFSCANTFFRGKRPSLAHNEVPCVVKNF